ELFECGFRRVELRGAAAAEERALHIGLVPAPLVRPPLVGLADDLPALAAAVVERAVSGLVDSDAPFAVEALIAANRLAPEAAPWLDEALNLLARFGAAAEQDGEWRLTSAGLPAVADLWRLLRSEAPRLVAELALVALAAEELPDLIRSGPRPLEAQKSPMVEHLL